MLWEDDWRSIASAVRGSYSLGGHLRGQYGQVLKDPKGRVLGVLAEKRAIGRRESDSCLGTVSKCIPGHAHSKEGESIPSVRSAGGHLQ